MCGDSSDASDVSALMNGKSARLCATDPPYLVSYDAKNHPSKGFSDGKNKDWKGRYADKSKAEPLGPFYEAFLRQALAICEDNAAIYVWCASQRQVEVEKAMRECGTLELASSAGSRATSPNETSATFPQQSGRSTFPSFQESNPAIPRRSRSSSSRLQFCSTPNPASFATNHFLDRGNLRYRLRLHSVPSSGVDESPGDSGDPSAS